MGHSITVMAYFKASVKELCVEIAFCAQYYGQFSPILGSENILQTQPSNFAPVLNTNSRFNSSWISRAIQGVKQAELCPIQ